MHPDTESRPFEPTGRSADLFPPARLLFLLSSTDLNGAGSIHALATCTPPPDYRLYATKRGERPRIGVAGAACQCTVRQSRPTASRSRSR